MSNENSIEKINDEKDWRIRDQDIYLMNKELRFSKFDKSIRNHDHCQFCWEKFSENESDLHVGYCTLDYYYWICEECYGDFKNMFQWKLIK